MDTYRAYVQAILRQLLGEISFTAPHSPPGGIQVGHPHHPHQHLLVEYSGFTEGRNLVVLKHMIGVRTSGRLTIAMQNDISDIHIGESEPYDQAMRCTFVEITEFERDPHLSEWKKAAIWVEHAAAEFLTEQQQFSCPPHPDVLRSEELSSSDRYNPVSTRSTQVRS